MIEISLALIAVYKNRLDTGRQIFVSIKGSNDANMSTPNEIFVLHRVLRSGPRPLLSTGCQAQGL